MLEGHLNSTVFGWGGSQLRLKESNGLAGHKARVFDCLGEVASGRSNDIRKLLILYGLGSSARVPGALKDIGTQMNSSYLK